MPCEKRVMPGGAVAIVCGRGRRAPACQTCGKAEAALHDAEAAIRFDAAAHDPRPIEEYHEDMGPVLWWTFPVVEAPYYGTPMDLGHQYAPGRFVGGFPDYVTHFTAGPDGNRVQTRFEEIERNYTVDVRRRKTGDADA